MERVGTGLDLIGEDEAGGTGREVTRWEGRGQDCSRRERTRRYETGWGEAVQDKIGQCGVGRDGARQDKTGRDSIGNDRVERGGTGRDTTGWDGAGWNGTGREWTDQTGRHKIGQKLVGGDES